MLQFQSYLNYYQKSRGFTYNVGVVFLTILALPALAQEVSPDIRTSAVDDNEQILLEIKKALVDEAQKSQSEVVNLSWLDPEGRLFDSTMIRSKVEVRGIQVKRYLDEINQPEIEVKLDSMSASLPQCAEADNKFKRTISVKTSHNQGEFGADREALGRDISKFGNEEVKRLLNISPNWMVQLHSPNVSNDTYSQIVGGPQIPESQYVLHVTTKLGRAPEMHKQEKIPGSDVFSIYWKGRPSIAEEFWVTLEMKLMSNSGPTMTWTGRSDFRVPYRPVTYSKPVLSTSVKKYIQQEIRSWTKQLDDFATCEPISFDLIASQENGFQVSGGTASGVSQGDRLLVLDKNKIPDRVLEPGALSDLSLVEVISVALDSAVVKHVAGAQLSDSINKVAVPF